MAKGHWKLFIKNSEGAWEPVVQDGKVIEFPVVYEMLDYAKGTTLEDLEWHKEKRAEWVE